MPTYPYECTSCGLVFDAIQKMTDPHLKECPGCGSNSLKRLICIPTLLLPRKHAPKLKPNAKIGKSPAYTPPPSMGGLHSISQTPNGIVVHPNLSGPPPGMAPEDGRIVIVEEDGYSTKKKKHNKDGS